MAREVKNISAAQKFLKFRNGTEVVVSPFSGVATQWTNDTGSLRALRLPAEEDMSIDFMEAMEALEIYEQETIHFDVIGPGLFRAFNSNLGNDYVVIRPAKVMNQPPAVKVILYQDEAGGLSWHFPDGFFKAENITQSPGLRGTPEAVFTIPTRTIKAQNIIKGIHEPTYLRGPITKWGRKIFKLLVIPLVAPLLAKPLDLIVGKIENKKRRNLIRSLTIENYQQNIKEPFKDWNSLNKKLALLVIHGIFSSTDGMLSMLPQDAMKEFSQFYEGRMIALDQLTVSNSPEDNARFFLEKVKKVAPHGEFEFDILCHSRGGIVARTLTERGHLLVPNHNCKFRNVYFVATPNQGSMLADPGHMVDMVDVFTNLLTNFPDGPASYYIEIFLGIIKLLAYAAGTSLPGIASMGTKGYIPEVLNRNPSFSTADYTASASNYDPDTNRDNTFFTGPFSNSIIDRIFTKDGNKVLNDLVVPRDGVYNYNGHPSFPIQNTLVYGNEAHVWHSGFFTQKQTINHIKQHFGLSRPTIDVILSKEKKGGAILTGLNRQDRISEPSISKDETLSKEEVEWLLNDSEYDEEGEYEAEGEDEEEVEGEYEEEVEGEHEEEVEEGQETTDKYYPNGQMRQPIRKEIPKKVEDTTGTINKDEYLPFEAAVELQRNPKIYFHENVLEEEVNELIVLLDAITEINRTEIDNLLNISFKAGELSVEVTVALSAPGFDLEGPRESKMIVKRDRDPEQEKAYFNLIARNPGPLPKLREITADFWLGNSCIGSVTHETYVIPKDYKGPMLFGGSSKNARFVVHRARREDCDLIIHIEGQNDSGMAPFRVSMRSEIPDYAYSGGYIGTLNIPNNDLATYLDQFYQTYFQNYPKAGTMDKTDYLNELQNWEKTFSDALRQLGKRLWMILPQRFQDEYFKMEEDKVLPRSILIHSDEMIFPWELVVPHRTTRNELVVHEPWGIAHILGRWIPKLRMKPIPQNLPVKNISILNPKYLGPNELPWSLHEIAALQELFSNVSVVSPANLNNVKSKLLDQSDIQIFHFSGHGQYNPQNADLNQLILENNEILDAFNFLGTKLCSVACPIVYLNACSVGMAGFVVGRMGGFAANFLNSGCSGVIAPYWPIYDKRAAKFSVSLYKKLKLGRAIGEALQELRLENPDDVTYQAYSYFGDPYARMIFP